MSDPADDFYEEADFPEEEEACWYCMGDGGWHDCGEDVCCCRFPQDNVGCPECGGTGFISVAPAVE